MLRNLGAFAWLRWRLLRNQIRGAKRRDTVEQISRALALLVPAMLVALALGSIVGIGVIGLLAGRAAALGTVDAALVTFITRVLLFIAFGLVVAMAVVAPIQSALTRYTRLLLLPIRRQSLHLVEVASTLADPWLAAFVVGLVTLPFGLFLGGAWSAGVVVLLAAVPLIALLALAGALTGFLAAWLLRSRRRGEAFTLVFVLGLSLVSYLPMILATRTHVATGPRQREPFSIEVFNQSLPRWTQALPSEIFARVLGAAMEGRRGDASAATSALFAEVVALALISSWAHRKLLDSVEGSGSARRGGERIRAQRWSLPLLGSTLSAVAFAQVRTALRSVRGRLSILLPGPMMALLSVVLARDDDIAWAGYVAAHGDMILGLSLVFALYAMQAFTMNLFGSDRSGLTLQFLSPIDDATLARGKFVGCLLIFSAATAICVAVALVVAPEIQPALWLAAVAGGFATLALMFPGSVWLSAVFPVASDLSKTGSGGNPHPLPMLVGTFGVLIAALPVAVLLVLARAWPGAAWLIALGLLVWLAVVIVLAWSLVGVAARTITARRENLAMVAQAR